VADFLTGAVSAMDVGISSLLNSQGIACLIIRGILQEKLVSQFTVRSGILIVVALAVAFPYFYRNHVTPKIALVFCILCIAVSLLASPLELVLDKETISNMSYYAFFITPLTLVVIAYLSIYIAIKHKLRKAINMQSNIQQRQRLQVKRECELGLTAFYIVLGFLFSYSFWFTTVLIGTICPRCTTQN
jgi:uncharacterized membrane protein YfcA